jgi:hypothetical protein
MPDSLRSATKTIAWVSLAVLVPLATMSLYLFVARRNGNVDSDTHFYLAFGASEVCGAICMYMLSRTLGWASRSIAVNVFVIVAYIGVATAALFFYSFGISLRSNSRLPVMGCRRRLRDYGLSES